MAKTSKNVKKSFKEMDTVELKKQLVVLREEFRVMHFKAEGSRSKNVKESATLKKQIARLMTELSAKK